VLANCMMDSALAFAAGKLDLEDVRRPESTLLLGESVRQASAEDRQVKGCGQA